MTVLTGLAAALLLQSFNQEISMVPLIQSPHNMKLFTFEKVYDRLLLEDVCIASQDKESAYHISQSKKLGKKPAIMSASFHSSHGVGSTCGNHRGGSSA
jgi:hypothetical protein